MSLSGFRFHKDEITDLIEDINLNGFSKVQIEEVEDIDVFLDALAAENFTSSKEPDDDAIDKSEEPDFFTRYFFKDAEDTDCYLDIYFPQEDGEDYNEDFFG